jgi:FkbM family methyltransferase
MESSRNQDKKTMSLISYAQNHEDILLWRGLKHVQNGFYVDIGASDPSEDSVTQLFYEHGWSGINIEPSLESYTNLNRERSRDINLCCAVGDYEGQITFYDVSTRGWSTSDQTVGESYRVKGEDVATREVPIFCLDTILEKYHQSTLIHFLKIDVEGSEASVLKGLNLYRFRPWVLVIESLSPITHTPSHDQWEAMILDSGYQFVHFDGLNRFYLAREHYQDLHQAFSYPPNVLDGFLPQVVVYWHTQAQQTQLQNQQLEASLQQTQLQNQQLEASLQQTQLQNQQLEASLQQTQFQNQQLEASLQQTQFQNQQLEASLQQTQFQNQQLEASLQQSQSQIHHLNNHIHHLGIHAQQLEADLHIVHTSRSWRLTSPLRKIGLVVRKIAKKYRGLRDRYHQGRQKRKRALLTEKHKSSNVTDIAPDSHLNAAAQLNFLEPFALPLPAGERILYLFVDHTIACPTNTGVQRVTRALATALVRCGEQVRYIKWNSDQERGVLLNLDEREQLACWNGPDLKPEDFEIYLPADCPSAEIQPRPLGENHWLIVPEVPHITFHDRPVTLDLILWARQTKLKIGFIFYDAIPIQRPEFVDMASKHATYMQQLLLADVIWPISNWSAQDLIAYWQYQEKADAVTMPVVNPLLLSGESSLRDRVTSPTPGQPLILSVGTLEPRKNQVALIQAFEAYYQQHPDTDWELVLVGNLHPAVASFVNHAVQTIPKIRHLGHVSDEELDRLYQACAFTVFPSVSEGFGLPILESLWYGKPCICANFGSMAEIAEAGGCLTVDTRLLHLLSQAIEQLIENSALRQTLATQAITRPIRSWDQYAHFIREYPDQQNNPATLLKTIYYWIDSTLQFPKNTGIQRVSRQLARGLMEMGLKLIPVKWDKINASFCPANRDELNFFAQWNGPSVAMWQYWVKPDQCNPSCWFLMPDLPLNLATTEQHQLIKYARNNSLHCAAIFYDAIPWKMRDIYPIHFAQAHREYMLELEKYDLVLPISLASRNDLINFLGAELPKPQSLESWMQTTLLPGQFTETPRITKPSPALSSDSVTILCVGTVEPRKNHEILLEAFDLADRCSGTDLKLIIVGRRTEPDLFERINAFIADRPNIVWKEDVDDADLHALQLACDFTVYPSIEEGFGLPILESLWYAKPCICANFGAMQEAAEGGGCLMVDVQSVEALAQAIQHLATDPRLYQTLVQEAIARPFKSWQNYAQEIAVRLARATPRNFKSQSLLTHQEIQLRMQEMTLPSRPLLSVCISTYNRADWLATSLKNWDRLYPDPLDNVELVVCDNTSPDHTPEVVQPYLNRSDFSYYRNTHNVGMLGNLRQTAHYASGQYIWILGDDDLLMPGAIERVVETLQKHPETTLVYLNYAYTRLEDARSLTDFETFFQEATPIVPAMADRVGPIHTICAHNENFFTAIYTLVFRRDHALKAYSQDTSGRPFSTMLTCIPTTYYVLHAMMNELGVWLGTPQVVVNMNVSWMKYAPLWILERIPEVYEEAERRGADSQFLDCWRCHTLPGLLHYFEEIFDHDPLNNAQYFSASRLVRRFKHLSEFQQLRPQFQKIYARAHARGHPAAQLPVSQVFPGVIE